MADALFPRLADPDSGEAVRLGEDTLSYRELAGAAAALAARLGGVQRVALSTAPSLELVVGAVGALAAGTTVIPVNPKAGTRELEHIVPQTRAGARPGRGRRELPAALAAPRVSPWNAAREGALPDDLGDEDTAIILYTSGTTGPPRASIPAPRDRLESRRARRGLAVDGATTGSRTRCRSSMCTASSSACSGPLRRGGSVEHRRPLLAAGDRRRARARRDDGLRRADDVPPARARGRGTTRLRGGVRAARGCSSPAPPRCRRPTHERIERLTGQRIVERYGMTETLMNISVRADGERRAGLRRPAAPWRRAPARRRRRRPIVVERRRDDRRDPGSRPEPLHGLPEPPRRDRGGVARRLVRDRRPGDARAERLHPDRRPPRDRPDQERRLQIGAGEIEAALLEHPAVAEVAVAGGPDADLGERIAAWVVPRRRRARRRRSCRARRRAAVVAQAAARGPLRHELPRNAMGKVMKKSLVAEDA